MNNLSDFIFGLIRAVGLILLGWGIVQVGLSFQSHDPSQRSNGFLTLAGGIVIADRYTTSNAVHQCSKLPPDQWDGFLRWAFEYEYQLLGLPAPDAVVYLQVDPAVSQKLMTQRYHGDESRKDVHEKDTEYLARSRCAAEYCAAHLGWAVVHCTSGDNMRSIEDIQAEVQEIVLKQLT